MVTWLAHYVIFFLKPQPAYTTPTPPLKRDLFGKGPTTSTRLGTNISLGAALDYSWSLDYPKDNSNLSLNVPYASYSYLDR